MVLLQGEGLPDVRKMMPRIGITHTPTLIAESASSDILCRPSKAISIPVIEPDTNLTRLSIRNANYVSSSISIPVANMKGSAIKTSDKAHRGFP